MPRTHASRVVRKGDPDSIEVLCGIAGQLMDRDTPSAYRDAARYLRRAAAAGDAWAQYHLGLIYHHGLGGRKSLNKAVKWYEKAAASEYDSALLNLGNILANLPGDRRDLKRAVALYRRAARLGNRNAAYNLGYYHSIGRGVKKDLHRAIKWYRQAADAGDRDSRLLLKHLSRALRRGTKRSNRAKSRGETAHQ